ncbi:MAG: GNAT family N-acetyltransferase [Candidatus Thorarchaeota archaeon]|jgi:predicted acetyltransferase
MEELPIPPDIVLPNGFEFCVVQSDEDVEELINFNTLLHNELIAGFLKRRIEHLPDFERRMNFFVRENETGKIVSAMSAVPSTWEYDGIPLRNLEVDCVGTHEDYRNRGFIRYLYQHFESELKNGEYHISTLQGIPEFFRQFDYDFIFPMGQFSGITLRIDQIPRIRSEKPPSFMDLAIRESETSDFEDMARLFDDVGNRLLVRSTRTNELWKIQERLKKWRSFDFITKVVEKDNHVIGYMRYIIHDENSPMTQVWGSPALDVIESSINSYDGVLRTIYYLKEIAQEHGVSLIFLPITSASNLSRIGMELGGQIESLWQHQIRVPNFVHLLNTISPALEKHLEGTMFSSITRELKINTYGNCYLLHFVDGKLSPVQELGRQPWGDLSIRNHDFIRLVLGESTLDELKKMNSDVTVSGELIPFVETLFPKGESFIHYYHC